MKDRISPVRFPESAKVGADGVCMFLVSDLRPCFILPKPKAGTMSDSQTSAYKIDVRRVAEESDENSGSGAISEMGASS